MAQEDVSTPPGATPTPSLANPFSPAARSPLQPAAATEATSGTAGPQVYQVSTPRDDPTAAVGPTVATSDLSAVMGMMAQTLQAVQAQTQAVTQLVSVLASQQQQQQQQRPVPPPPPVAAGSTQSSEVTQGLVRTPAVSSDSAAGRPLDPKWIPSVPEAQFTSWRTRVEEITGFWAWCEAFGAWLALIHPSFVGELREVLTRSVPLSDAELSGDQWARAQRLYHLVKQTFQGCQRVEGIFGVYEAQAGVGACNGYELMRLLRQEYSLQTRSEALHFRNAVLQFRVVKPDNLVDRLRQIDAKVFQYQQLLRTFPFPAQVRDLQVMESDLYILMLQNLPDPVREFAQLHGGESVAEVRKAVLLYHNRTCLVGDVGRVQELTTKPPKGHGRGRGSDRDTAAEDGSPSGGKAAGKGKDKGKGKGSKTRSTSQDGSGNKGIVCWECGKPGHVAKECANKRPQSAGRERKKDIVCHRCGKPGHVKRDCRVRLATLGSEQAGPDEDPAVEEAKVVMTLSSHVQRAVESTVDSVSVVRVSPQAEWLVDSGATSHIVSRQFLPDYTVAHRYEGLSCELRAANGALIETFGIVDVEIKFSCKSRGKPLTRTFVLSRCIVADTPLNVMSPFVLHKNGWRTVLADEKASCLNYRRDLKVGLVLKDRAWWTVARLPSAQSSKKGDSQAEDPQGPKPMDLSALTAGMSPSQVAPQVVEAGRLTFLLRGLEDTPRVDDKGRRRVSFQEPTAVEAQPTEVVEDSSSEARGSRSAVGLSVPSLGPLGGNREGVSVDERVDLEELVCAGEDCVSSEPVDHPIPSLEEGEAIAAEDPTDPLDPSEVELGAGGTYQHVAQGHFPFLASCTSCCRASGRVPARRLRHTRGKCELAADFCFFGRVRLLVMVVLYTGMIASCVMDGSDHDRNVRQVNHMWRELGMTGRTLETTIDGEGLLHAVFRAAARQPNTPVTGVSFLDVPPDRHQANGRAERAVQTVKRGVASNLLFLESRFRKRIALESPLLKHLVPYVARTHNIFHVPQASDTSAFDKLRGRRGGPKPATLPFGVLALAKATESARVHDLEQLSEIVYLGPVSTSGGGILGIMAGDSRVGLSHEEAVKVRKFQAGRIVSPCVWSWEDLQHLVVTSDTVPGQQFPAGPVSEVRPGADDEQSPAEADAPPGLEGGVVVPASGPPKKWLLENGFTPDCSACGHISKSGVSHGRVHNANCRKRYRKYLEDEAQARRKRKSEQDLSESSGSGVSQPVPRRVTGKQPLVSDSTGVPSNPAHTEPPFPVDASPSLGPPDPVAVGPSIPGTSNDTDVEMSPPEPIPEPMEVDALIDHVTCEAENLFFLRDVNFRQVEDVVWFESQCLGKKIWQSMPRKPLCEATGRPLDVEQLKKGLIREHEQLTKLKVGFWVTDTEAKHGSRRAGSKLLGTRWVLVQKPDKVRARLVCKDFRSAGLSSFREEFYSPTAGLESLRLLLALAHQKQWFMCTADVSTAFMFASLGDAYQAVALPPSTVGPAGERLFLVLQKALYGLRKAPLFWFKELKAALLSLGFTPTSEATVFRFAGEDDECICLVLIYVDDLLAVGQEATCRWVLRELGRKYEIKITGEMCPETPGYLEFLGREIRRETASGPLFLGLRPSYFDGIEEASGWSLKATPTPPALHKYVDEKGVDKQLEADRAGQFRTVLGKLAWFSLTVPVLAYQISWCSSYQQSPTEMSEQGLREVLKYAKSFRRYRQGFGVDGCLEWAPSDKQIIAVVDASWSVRSVMGGIILCCGAAVKVWSRRIQTACLSSAEAELHAIAEGCKESLAVGIALQTCLEGLPKRDWLGIPVTTRGDYPLLLYTDSESGQHISNMQGLLRRIKHVELRALLVQELTESGRLKVYFVAGSANPSDALTKSSDKHHVLLLILALGMSEGDLDAQIASWADQVVSVLGPVSPQNRRRITEGIQRGLARVVPRSSVCLSQDPVSSKP